MIKLVGETKALQHLAQIRCDFASTIQKRFEQRAKPCSQCETPGACCLDEHFVNVRISRIEAAAIRRALDDLPESLRSIVKQRTENAVARLESKGGEKYACPLYEKDVGCLVHHTAKPLPCIAHACYERKEDLPPDELLAEQEMRIADLNRRVYGRSEPLQPIPIAIRPL